METQIDADQTTRLETLCSETDAVRLWRDTFKLNCNRGRKYDINVTVKDLRLWKFVLDHWGYWSKGRWVSFNPLSIGKQLSEYERLADDRPARETAGYGE